MIASCTPLQPIPNHCPTRENPLQVKPQSRKSRFHWKLTGITGKLPPMAVIEAEVVAPANRKRVSESAILQVRAATGYKDYSAERKAEILAQVTAHGGNVAQVARLTDIPHQTIRSWLEQADRYSELQTQKQTDLAQKLENNAHKLADSIAEHDLTIVPLQSKATALGIMVDKMQLLRGQPTSIHEERTIDSRQVLVLLQETIGPSDPTPQPALNPANTES
jgi:transposase-like protein